MVVKRARLAAALAGSAAVLLALSGCSVLQGPTPATPERPQIAEPETPPELVPGGTAEENLPFFRQVLADYAAGDQPIAGRPIVDALAEQGFDTAAMQVSHDQSKTGLDADSIYVSVRSGETCLVGQVAADGREAVAQAVAAVGPDKNVCLIGDTRRIDW